eukprot:m51a1_g8356 hypothetical protein (464) ;mRNA; f:65467-69131
MRVEKQERHRHVLAVPLGPTFVAFVGVSVAVTAVISIVPLTVLWQSSVGNIGGLASASLERRALEYQRSVIQGAAGNFSAIFALPLQGADLMARFLPPSIWETHRVHEIVNTLHGVVRPIAMVMPGINDLVFWWMQGTSIQVFQNKAPGTYMHWETGYPNYTLFYYNGTQPTRVPYMTSVGWNFATRAPYTELWKANGSSTWIDPYLSVTKTDIVMHFIEPLWSSAGRLAGSAQGSVTLAMMREYVQRLPLTEHGSAFVFDSKMLMLSGSRQYAVWDKAFNRYSVFASPNETVVRFATRWFNITGGVATPASFRLDGVAADFVSVPLPRSRRAVWLCVMSPLSDYTKDLDELNEAELAKAQKTCLTASLVVAGVGLLILVLVLKLNGTVFFLDVKQFTSTMNQHGVALVIEVLHQMFDSFSTIIQSHKGVIDKYIGVFELPGSMEDLSRVFMNKYGITILLLR